MSDLIDRQAAIEALVAETIYTEEELKEYYEANSHRNEWVNGIYEAVEVIKQLPPTQPERIKGRWIQKSQVPDTVRGYWATCSSCGRGSFGGGNFCRECGSDNRKVTE